MAIVSCFLLLQITRKIGAISFCIFILCYTVGFLPLFARFILQLSQELYIFVLNFCFLCCVLIISAVQILSSSAYCFENKNVLLYILMTKGKHLKFRFLSQKFYFESVIMSPFANVLEQQDGVNVFHAISNPRGIP